jgi:signal transduction histidine kinase
MCAPASTAGASRPGPHRAAGRRASAGSRFRRLRERAQPEDGRGPITKSGRSDCAGAEAAWRRAAFLAEASARLATSLDLEVTLRAVARLLVPALADFCAVEVPDEERGPALALVARADRARAPRLRREPPDSPRLDRGPGALAVALRAGRPLILPVATDEVTGAAGAVDTQPALPDGFRPASLLAVPLLARGRRVGAMLLVMAESGRCYGPADLALAEDLGWRVALAVDNARLHRAALHAVGARDEILAATSHELRTPLGHIKGFVSTLRQPDVDWDAATRGDFLAEIEREADRLQRLVEDLLDMSRLDGGGLDRARCAPVPPRALVAGALRRVGELGGRRLALALPNGLPPVLADAAQLELALKNLLENAAKYSPPGTAIRVSGEQAGGEVRLSVEDEGLGIPPEHLERVFERFFRVAGAGLPAQPGSGLGLAICRGIVECHGGRVWAENRPEGGARFVVCLPTA